MEIADPSVDPWELRYEFDAERKLWRVFRAEPLPFQSAPPPPAPSLLLVPQSMLPKPERQKPTCRWVLCNALSADGRVLEVEQRT